MRAQFANMADRWHPNTYVVWETTFEAASPRFAVSSRAFDEVLEPWSGS